MSTSQAPAGAAVAEVPTDAAVAHVPAADVVGYDVPQVEAWISAHVPALQTPLRWTRLEGGHSNLTYLVDDAQGRKAVIRRPPMGELLPKAHDMAREWALISALGGMSGGMAGDRAVPVPAALGFCEDTRVTGAHFYLMGHVAGHPLYSADDARRWAPEPLRQTLGHSFIDVLADLHAIDPDAVGLGDLGKKDDYIGRQLKTWYRSWNASIAGAQLHAPRAHALQRYFLAHTPEQGPARNVHGDYGLHNTLI
ncbi:MAG: phosphotransferase family protein, partial [Microbacteriaceae bacterium]|nr:phosphotransferase family protein [Burkholderiaceae bacterium]